MLTQFQIEFWDGLTTLLFDLAAAAYVSHNMDKCPLPKKQPVRGFLLRQQVIWRRARKNWPAAKKELFSGKSLRWMLLVLGAEVALCCAYPYILRFFNMPVTLFACLRLPLGMFIWDVVVLILLVAGDDEEDNCNDGLPTSPRPSLALPMPVRRPRSRRVARPTLRPRPKTVPA